MTNSQSLIVLLVKRRAEQLLDFHLALGADFSGQSRATEAARRTCLCSRSGLTAAYFIDFRSNKNICLDQTSGGWGEIMLQSQRQLDILQLLLLLSVSDTERRLNMRLCDKAGDVSFLFCFFTLFKKIQA